MEESFEYQLGMLFIGLHERFENDKTFISKILTGKDQILNEDSMVGDANFISRNLDDVIRLHQLIENNKVKFGKFVYYHTGMDFWTEENILHNGRL